jgi:DNA-binding transcriptional MocR family regulator
VLHCSSFSKTLAPGYRIGWAAPGRFLEAVTRQKLMASLATTLPAQLGLAKYLERGGFERHLRVLRQTFEQHRDHAIAAIGEHFPLGTRVSRPAGGYFLWIELPAGADAIALHRRAMDAGISCAPGPMFSASQGFANCLRINVGHPPVARMEAALATLGALASRR